MKKFILHIIGTALVVYYLLPELVSGISIDSGRTAVIVALLFALINFAIKPILRVITLPLNLLSFGLFGLLINILLFWFVASIIDGFIVVDFMSALWGALALTIANWILDKLTG
ncbi:phage holin family protein [Patescibacteria group bacterium]|nr:phage holin family protein [Patescibacteria group bacterium]